MLTNARVAAIAFATFISVALGDGLRMGRNHPTVEVELLTSDGPASRPAP